MCKNLNILDQWWFTKIKNVIKYTHSIFSWLLLHYLFQIIASTGIIINIKFVMTRIFHYQIFTTRFIIILGKLHLGNIVCISHFLQTSFGNFFSIDRSINQKENTLFYSPVQDTFSVRVNVLKWQIGTSMDLKSIHPVQRQSYNFYCIFIQLVVKWIDL